MVVQGMRLAFLKLAVCVSVFLFGWAVVAEEVDDYVRDFKSLPPDSVIAINGLINEQFKEFAEKAAFEDKKCDRKELVQKILYFFDQNFSSVGNKLRDRYMIGKGVAYTRFGRNIVKNTSHTTRNENTGLLMIAEEYIPEHGATKAESVYKDTSTFCCADTVNVNGYLIGIDKIDHFFGNGGLLWERKQTSPATTLKELAYMNSHQESGTWGLGGGGVKSYGDLAANWDGFKFYQEIIDGPHPYLSCKDGKIQVLREFDLKDHIKLSWRESANCSAFSSPDVATKLANNLKEMNTSCPQDVKDCEKIINLYKGNPDLVSTLVSPVCLRKISIKDSVEVTRELEWTDLTDSIGGIRVKDVKDFLIRGRQ